jgi:hypothetical protein
LLLLLALYGCGAHDEACNALHLEPPHLQRSLAKLIQACRCCSLSAGQNLLLLSLICGSTVAAAQGASMSYPTSARPAPCGHESAQNSLRQHADRNHALSTWKPVMCSFIKNQASAQQLSANILVNGRHIVLAA